MVRTLIRNNADPENAGAVIVTQHTFGPQRETIPEEEFGTWKTWMSDMPHEQKVQKEEETEPFPFVF
jgi:hypothetical protein